MISTPDDALQMMIKRALSESGCPPHILEVLMEKCHERRWPLGLSSLETRQNNQRIYDNYVCRRIPGILQRSQFLISFMVCRFRQKLNELICDFSHQVNKLFWCWAVTIHIWLMTWCRTRDSWWFLLMVSNEWICCPDPREHGIDAIMYFYRKKNYSSHANSSIVSSSKATPRSHTANTKRPNFSQCISLLLAGFRHTRKSRFRPTPFNYKCIAWYPLCFNHYIVDLNACSGWVSVL